VVDFDDFVPQRRFRVQSQAAPGDIAFNDFDAARECGVNAFQFFGAGASQAGELRLNQAKRSPAGRTRQNPGEQGGSQKAGEPGEE
jgi:hypothetical protein